MGKGVTAAAVVLAILGGTLAAGPTAAAADCGGLLQPACPPATTPTTPATPPVPPAGPKPISAARYAKLDAALAAQRKLDARAPSAADLRRARRACDALGTADPLLKALRGTCLKLTGAIRATAAVSSCPTRSACRRALGDIAPAFADWAAASHRQTRAVDRLVKDQGCRTALRVSRSDLKLLDRVAPAFRAVIKASRTSDRADDARAEKRLDAIPFADLRSSTSAYRAFTADCR